MKAEGLAEGLAGWLVPLVVGVLVAVGASGPLVQAVSR